MERRLSLRQTPGGPVRGLFTFVLMGGFAVLALLVVLVGARVYSAIERRSTENYQTRTALSYVAGKVRAVDGHSVFVREAAGTRVLVLETDAGGTAYNTYLYYGEAGVCEYFGRAERAFDAALGACILDAAGFDAALDGGLLSVTVTDRAGRAQTLRLHLNGGDGA